MPFYIEKLLLTLIYPLSLALLLCIAAFALSFAGRADAFIIIVAVAVILLWLASTPALASLLTNLLEEQNPPVSVETISPQDVAIVLTGGVAGRQSTTNAVRLGPTGDRLMQAAMLWRAGKAQTIIISGGIEPPPAAELLEACGVPVASIIVEINSSNTHENAVNTVAIWREIGFQSGLLVTSATHMPRALASFRKSGLDLAPWPADLRGRYPLVNSGFDFLPDAGALAKTTSAIKEWLGMVVYRLRGWA